MNHAKRYLAESDERLREIAQRVGYKDEFYFSRIFKRRWACRRPNMPKFKALIAACSSIIGQLATECYSCGRALDAKWTRIITMRIIRRSSPA